MSVQFNLYIHNLVRSSSHLLHHPQHWNTKDITGHFQQMLCNHLLCYQDICIYIENAALFIPVILSLD